MWCDGHLIGVKTLEQKEEIKVRVAKENELWVF